MNTISGLLERTLAALIMAMSVALLTLGLFSYAPALGDVGPSPDASEVAGNPVFGTDEASIEPATESPATESPATESPTDPASESPTVSPATESPATSASPVPTTSASAAPGASPSSSPSPSGTVRPSPSPSSVAGGGAVASRIAIPSLRVDLPIMAGDAQVRGNRDSYPLCDVAQYLVYFVNPGQVGTSYIYAHAQRGMFLPLLRASQRNDGAEMIGALVEVYTADNKLHLYEIFRVKRHARDLSLANSVAPGQHMLVLQTSEGTRGHPPKLQVAARPIGILPATPREANPVPQPRPCWR